MVTERNGAYPKAQTDGGGLRKHSWVHIRPDGGQEDMDTACGVAVRDSQSSATFHSRIAPSSAIHAAPSLPLRGDIPR